MKPGLSDIQLEAWDNEIIVSLLGIDYAGTYYKPANSPQLLAKNFLTITWTLCGGFCE